ncbi:MAG: redoxin domain-containing protein [Verrucomicrobia bacterium]|nr:redoxin domain-containing protein [Verrucomicrobiota bacterium]
MKATPVCFGFACAFALLFSSAATPLHAATPAEELQVLMQEAQASRRQPDKVAPKMLDFAQRNVKDPSAADALVWIINATQFGKEFDAAADLLRENHAASDKIGGALAMLGDSDGEPAEKALRAIVEKNSNRAIQAGAAFNLGLWLVQESERQGRLSGADAAFKIATDADKYFSLVIEKYPESSSVGRAKKELNAVRTLSFGRPAPEIAGEDQKGESFKLSDYRGKAVAIVFWGDW